MNDWGFCFGIGDFVLSFEKPSEDVLKPGEVTGTNAQEKYIKDEDGVFRVELVFKHVVE